MGGYHQHIQSTSHHTQLADPSHPHRHHHLAGKLSAKIEQNFGLMESKTTDSFSEKEVHFFLAFAKEGSALGDCYPLLQPSLYQKDTSSKL